MTIKVGDRLPEGTLSEFVEVEGNGCSVGPNQFKVEDLTKGKKVVIFGLPGAFTPTCSAKHVPSYLANFDKLKAKGVDAVYCLSVNDPFVMGAWGRDQKAGDKVHMMADGSAEYTKKLGLELDLTGRGMGVRCQRFSMLVDDGVVKALNVEAPESTRSPARRRCSHSSVPSGSAGDRLGLKSAARRGRLRVTSGRARSSVAQLVISLDVREDAVELLEAVVVDHEAPGPLLPGSMRTFAPNFSATRFRAARCRRRATTRHGGPRAARD